MNKWAFLVGALAAVGAVLVVGLALRRSGDAAAAEQIPDVIADCFDRIHRIEAELHRLRPPSEQPA